LRPSSAIRPRNSSEQSHEMGLQVGGVVAPGATMLECPPTAAGTDAFSPLCVDV
jgi:hypothetical protein